MKGRGAALCEEVAKAATVARDAHHAHCVQVLVRTVLFDDRGAALLSTVQLLPALTEFAIYATQKLCCWILATTTFHGVRSLRSCTAAP